MKTGRRSESSHALKKPTLSALADDIRSGHSPPTSPLSKRVRAGTVLANNNVKIPPIPLEPVPLPIERKSLRRSASIGDIKAMAEILPMPQSPSNNSFKESHMATYAPVGPVAKSLKIHL